MEYDPIVLVKTTAAIIKTIKDMKASVATPERNAELSLHIDEVKRNYRKLMLEHPAVAVAKEVDANLWKICFYRQIEEFRHNLKSAAKASANGNGSETDAHMFRLSSEFDAFLGKAEHFYQSLLHELMALKETSSDSTKCAYSCVLYLGDLSRYKETTREPKDYSAAERYYERAAFLCPHLGNAQNQLAVLASYGGADCVAVYRYFRSVMLCPTGEQRPDTIRAVENLRVLFAKNLAEFREQDLSQPSKRGLKASAFLVLFVRLHAILFDATDDKPIAVDFIAKLSSLVLVEFEELLMAAVFGDTLLMRLLVLNICSVHLASAKAATPHPVGRSTVESLALAFLMGWVKICALRVSEEHSQKKVKRAPVARLLPSLAVFATWATEQQGYLSPCTVPSGEASTEIELARKENRARSGMRSTVSALIGPIEHWSKGSSMAPREGEILAEHMELLGLPPIASALEREMKGIKTFETAARRIASDEASFFLRLAIIRRFLPVLEAAAAHDSDRAKSSASKVKLVAPINFMPTDKLVRPNSAQRLPKKKAKASSTSPGRESRRVEDDRVIAPTEQTGALIEVPSVEPVVSQSSSVALEHSFGFDMWGNNSLVSPPLPSAVKASPDSEDSDDPDEVIVFRPNFSRKLSPAPSDATHVVGARQAFFSELDRKLVCDDADRGMTSRASMASIASDFADHPETSRFLALMSEPRHSTPPLFAAVSPPPGFAPHPQPPPGFGRSPRFGRSPFDPQTSAGDTSPIFQYSLPSKDSQSSENAYFDHKW